MNSSMDDVSLLEPPVLAFRPHSCRTETCFPPFTVQDLRSQPANVTSPCTTSSVHFPFLCSMYECSYSKTTLLPCNREQDCRDVPPDHRFCSVVELMANLLRAEKFNLMVHTLTCQHSFWGHGLIGTSWACVGGHAVTADRGPTRTQDTSSS